MSRSFARPDVFAAAYIAILADDLDAAARQANARLRALCLASAAGAALTLAYLI